MFFRVLILLLAWSYAEAAAPKAPRPVVPPKTTYRIPMADGTKLATDVYLPEGNGPFPVILARHPYDKNIPTFWAAGFVPKGFAFVIQDTRGRFASEGENLPFIGETPQEYSDSKTTLQWIGAQSWCNGKIGTYGQSAVTIAQYLMWLDDTPQLAAQHLTVGTPSLYHGMIYPGGIFKNYAAEWLERQKFSPQSIEIWKAHARYDSYWKSRDLRPHYHEVNAPAVHIGGYYDVFASMTIDAFHGYQKKGGPEARGKQKLVMGPWMHGTFNVSSGELIFENAKTPPGKMHDAVAWFEEHLMGIDNGIAREPVVRYYVMGNPYDKAAPGKGWREAATWPPRGGQKTPYYLIETGRLSATPPSEGKTGYRYDPANPAPTIGGLQLQANAGSRNQAPLESREDVLSFSTDILAAPLEITGDPVAELWISSDAPDTDFFIKLCDVHPDGRSYNFSEGQLAARFRESFEQEKWLKPGKKYRLQIPLSPTSIILNKGHRLRVLITSSSVPASPPNPNTGEGIWKATGARVARNTIHVGKNGSRIHLPAFAPLSEAGGGSSASR